MIRILNAVLRRYGRIADQKIGERYTSGCRSCGNTHTKLQFGLCGECIDWLHELRDRPSPEQPGQPHIF